MSSRQEIKEVGCSACGCAGKTANYEYLGDGDYGSTIVGYSTCDCCKGRKNHKVMFIVTDESCDAAMWDETKIKCQNGAMKNTEPFYRYGKNFFGQETRERVSNISRKCPFCFGTGRKHYVAKKVYCSNCRGKGSIQESKWEKSFFGGEVKKEYTSTCQACRGGKFEWEIDSDFSNTQTNHSNL
jgi:hypothetical protein